MELFEPFTVFMVGWVFMFAGALLWLIDVALFPIYKQTIGKYVEQWDESSLSQLSPQERKKVKRIIWGYNNWCRTRPMKVAGKWMFIPGVPIFVIGAILYFF